MRYKAVNLKKYRLNNKFTQEDLERESKVSRATIARLEAGSRCNKTQIERLANALTVTIDMLIYDDQGTCDDFDIDVKGESILASEITCSETANSKLNEDQKKRIRKMAEIFAEPMPDSIENWILDFECDYEPAAEIKMWEYMADAYLCFTRANKISLEQKKETFNYLLLRSQNSRKQMSGYKPKCLTNKLLKDLVKRCKFKGEAIHLEKLEGTY